MSGNCNKIYRDERVGEEIILFFFYRYGFVDMENFHRV